MKFFNAEFLMVILIYTKDIFMVILTRVKTIKKLFNLYNFLFSIKL